jgi:hypothetical protein
VLVGKPLIVISRLPVLSESVEFEQPPRQISKTTKIANLFRLCCKRYINSSFLIISISTSATRSEVCSFFEYLINSDRNRVSIGEILTAGNSCGEDMRADT